MPSAGLVDKLLYAESAANNSAYNAADSRGKDPTSLRPGASAMPLPPNGHEALVSHDNGKSTAYQVTSPIRLRMKMPEDRLLLAFR
jgi:hypothetical protein